MRVYLSYPLLLAFSAGLYLAMQAPAWAQATPAASAPGAKDAKPAAPAAPVAPPKPMPETRIGEIPLNQPAQILGIVTSVGPAYFVLNDGGASIIVSAGPGWQQLTNVRQGDRLSVIGQLDKFGSGMFMAGAITTTEGRTVSVKPYR